MTSRGDICAPLDCPGGGGTVVLQSFFFSFFAFLGIVPFHRTSRRKINVRIVVLEFMNIPSLDPESWLLNVQKAEQELMPARCQWLRWPLVFEEIKTDRGSKLGAVQFEDKAKASGSGYFGKLVPINGTGSWWRFSTEHN